MDDKVFDRIKDVDLQKTMETSYIDYAMSVIVARALPDVRDGLKPVQRRILYAMSELNNGPDKPHRKCARIVGDTMGKYHPHGDTSIYGSMVYMAQPWSLRYPLIDGHGNFGSVDGDGAAAMRYTEARLTKLSMEMLGDINKDTVDFVPNFDETEKEPSVLPSRFPNLLVNGTTGIAVGMATNIPPHNMRDVIAACTKIINNRIEEDRETDIDELISIVKAPDFPTGGIIMGTSGATEAYRTGRGKIITRAVTDIEAMPNGKSRIVVTELPYLVNKANLIQKIAELVRDKKIDGITGLRDESDREGMRIVIELRRDANARVVMNQLYKYSQLQDTFSVNMLTLVGNEPKTLNLQQMLYYYLMHQKEVIRRRTEYDLEKAQARAHILEGLLKALDYIDEIVNIIRHSDNVAQAKERLISRFDFSDVQAQAIVDMRLRALTGLERERLEDEYRELEDKIALYQAILSNEKLLYNTIKEEILIIKTKYADPRRTYITYEESEINIEDTIKNEQVVITMTNLGYIKRTSLDMYRSQHRGGKGIKGLETREEDYVTHLFVASTHDYIQFFTNKGKVFRLRVYEIQEAGRTARGQAIVNLLSLSGEEKVTAAIIAHELSDDDGYLIMATRKGTVKKTRLSEFANIRQNGLIVINLANDDELIEVKHTHGDDQVFLATQNGQMICFDEKDVRPMGRTAAGVRGMNLDPDDKIIGMQLGRYGEELLAVTQGGLGKRTALSEFSVQHRGGKGIRYYKITKKTGPVVGFNIVRAGQGFLLINSEGTIIRLEVSDVRQIGRAASGVKLIDMNKDVQVVGLALIREEENADE